MNKEKEIIKTSIVGIIMNFILVIAKIFIGIIAVSISVILDGVNNLTDMVSSLVTIVGTKLSNKKPDKKHPYGHGRVEFVTSSIIGIIIFVAGALAIYESIMALIKQETPTYYYYSFIVISVAIVIKIVLGLYFRHKAKKVNSDTLKASGLDALLDALLSTGTLVGAIISFTTGVHLEGYIGIIIGLFIIKNSIDVIRESVSKIIGERADNELIKEMIHDIGEVKEVRGVYDLIINNYGNDRYIASVHVEVSDKLNAKEIQFLEREITYIAYSKYNTIMTVGIYASNDFSDEDKKIKDSIFKIVLSHKEIVQIHGFYIDLKKKLITFDIIVDIANPKPEEIYKAVCEDVKKAYPNFDIHVTLDTDFSLI